MKNTRLLSHIHALTLLLLCAFVTPTTWAQKFPNAPLKLLVGTPPGGTTDIMARLIAQKMGEVLGQQVVVENRDRQHCAFNCLCQERTAKRHRGDQ